MIKALHINSTAPFRIRKKGADYTMADFDVLCTIMSALMWKKYNGPIKLYADKMAYDFYASLGILDIWDEIDTEVLENLPQDIDYNIYWAGSKLFAIKHETVPFAVIDTDLIVWKSLQDYLNGKYLVALHTEPLNEVYPPQYDLHTAEDYQYDSEWDWNQLPCNCAFTYYESEDFKNYYTSSAIKFMKNNNARPKNLVIQMVFAEQRLFSMCARKMLLNIHTLLDSPFSQNNDVVTHLWGGKDVARELPEENEKLCRALALKIQQIFPDFISHHIELEFWKKYL